MTFVNMFANPYMYNFQPSGYSFAQYGMSFPVFPFINFCYNNPYNFYQNIYNPYGYLNNTSYINFSRNYNNSYKTDYSSFNTNDFSYNTQYNNYTNPFKNYSNFFESDSEPSKKKRTKVSSSAERAVEVAERELAKGVSENLGKNDGTEIRKYKKGAKNNLPWCGYFTSYCYGEGQGSSNKSTFGYTGSSQEMKRLAKGHYAGKNTGYTPQKGDLAIWTYSGSSGHVGIVSKVYDDGSFDVIQGNSSNKIRKIHYKSQNSVGNSFDGFVKMSEWLA